MARMSVVVTPVVIAVVLMPIGVARVMTILAMVLILAPVVVALAGRVIRGVVVVRVTPIVWGAIIVVRAVVVRGAVRAGLPGVVVVVAETDIVVVVIDAVITVDAVVTVGVVVAAAVIAAVVTTDAVVTVDVVVVAVIAAVVVVIRILACAKAAVVVGGIIAIELHIAALLRRWRGRFLRVVLNGPLLPSSLRRWLLRRPLWGKRRRRWRRRWWLGNCSRRGALLIAHIGDGLTFACRSKGASDVEGVSHPRFIGEE